MAKVGQVVIGFKTQTLICRCGASIDTGPYGFWEGGYEFSSCSCTASASLKMGPPIVPGDELWEPCVDCFQLKGGRITQQTIATFGTELEEWLVLASPEAQRQADEAFSNAALKAVETILGLAASSGAIQCPGCEGEATLHFRKWRACAGRVGFELSCTECGLRGMS